METPPNSSHPLVRMELHETRSTIRLAGDVTVTCAGELKTLLLEGLASGREVQLDLARAGEIDVAILQLLWAAGRQAQRSGTTLVTDLSESADRASREAGFDGFPGHPAQE